MSEAWFGFLGVIVGAAVSLLGEQLVTRREREARQALRDQERKDRRDAFQRETLLAIQDVVTDTADALWREWDRKLLAVEVVGRWPVRGPDEPLPKDWTQVDTRTRKLGARVFDGELVRLLSEFQHQSGLVITALTRDAMVERMDSLSSMSRKINIRLSELLEDLF